MLFLQPKMNSQQPEKPKINGVDIVDLPEGVYRPALSEPIPQRWDKLLLADLRKICSKADISFPKLISSLAKQFRDKNKHLL